MTTDQDRVLRGSLERDQVIQVGSLHGTEKFEGEIENCILNTFINFKPVKRFQKRSGVSEFRSFNNGTSKRVSLFWICWRRCI